MKLYIILLLCTITSSNISYSAHASTAQAKSESYAHELLLSEISQGHFRRCTFETSITDNPDLLANAVRLWGAKPIADNNELDLVSLQLHMLNRLLVSLGAICAVSRVTISQAKSSEQSKVLSFYKLSELDQDDYLEALYKGIKSQNQGVVNISDFLRLVQSGVKNACTITESSVMLPKILIPFNIIVGNDRSTRANKNEAGIWAISFPKQRIVRSVSSRLVRKKHEERFYEPILLNVTIPMKDDSSTSGSFADTSDDEDTKKGCVLS